MMVEARKSTKSISLTVDNFSRQCEENCEWDMISSKEFYIKKSAVYYFIDADFLKIMFLTQNMRNGTFTKPLESRFNFIVVLQKQSVVVKEMSIRKRVDVQALFDAHEYMTAYFKIPLSMNLVKRYAMNTFDSMSVTIIDTETGKSTRKPLDVKIRYLFANRAYKKGSMHCGSCKHLTRKDDLADTEWTIRLHKKMGYDRKQFCDHMIEKDPGFSRIFKDYKDFLDLETLKCIPNLQAHDYLSNQTFLSSYLDLTTGANRAYSVQKYDIITMLVENDCYTNNIDKYKYIEVSDTDEVIFPKLIRKYNTLTSVIDLVSNLTFAQNDPFASITCDSNNTTISDFIEYDLLPRLDTKHIDHPVSLHFKHGAYLFNNIVDELFKSLRSTLTNNLNNLNLTIQVIQKDRAAEFKIAGPLTFTITSRKELRYALKLLELYDKMIQPFLVKHKKYLEEKVGSFDRLFFVSGDLNDHAVGKTIHDTRRTIDIFLHFSTSYITVDKSDDQFTIAHERALKDLIVPRELAHLSHYRKFLNFDPKSSLVPLSAFHFDLNYFKCFMIPLLNEK
jgi:hypothetical protein